MSANYTKVFQNGDLRRAVWNSFELGLLGSTATMVLGGIVAYVTARTEWRGRRLIDALAWLPWGDSDQVFSTKFGPSVSCPGTRYVRLL